jgi:hypothetical protein
VRCRQVGIVVGRTAETLGKRATVPLVPEEHNRADQRSGAGSRKEVLEQVI